MFRRFDATPGRAAATVVAPAADKPPLADKPRRSAPDAQWLDLKTRLHQRLPETRNLPANETVPENELRREATALVRAIPAEEQVALSARAVAPLDDETR